MCSDRCKIFWYRLLKIEPLFVSEQCTMNRGKRGIILSSCERSNNGLILWSKTSKDLKNKISLFDMFTVGRQVIRDSLQFEKEIKHGISSFFSSLKLQSELHDTIL